MAVVIKYTFLVLFIFCSIRVEATSKFDLSRIKVLLSETKNSDDISEIASSLTREISNLDLPPDSCYRLLAPLLRETMLIDKDLDHKQHWMSVVKLADNLLHARTSLNDGSCITLLADELFQACIARFDPKDVRWSCDLSCNCSCEVDYESVRSIFSKNGYSLALTKPDHVKICRELKKQNYAYLITKFRDRYLSGARFSPYDLGSFGMMATGILLVVGMLYHCQEEDTEL